MVEVRGAGSGRLRLRMLADASRASLTPWVKGTVKRGAIAHTDGWNGYGELADVGYDHRPRRQRRRHPHEQKLLPRAHRASSNLKTWLQGTHRGVSPALGLGALHEPTTYHQITRPVAMPLAEQTG